jgi:hypothetical protein
MFSRPHRAALSASQTVQALVDFTIASFPESLSRLSDDVTAELSHFLGCYLRNEISYEQLADTFTRLVGVTSPVDDLRRIVETADSPIPTPDTQVSANGRRYSRSWSPYEDQRLLAGILKHGIENWTSISKFVGSGRTRSQCSQRWYRGLNPRISKDCWTPEEDDRLLYTAQTYGLKSWTTIASKLGGRSDVQCRHRYRHLSKIGAIAQAPDTETHWVARPAPSVLLPPVHVMDLHYPSVSRMIPIPISFPMGYIETRPLAPPPPPRPPPPVESDRPRIPIQFQIPPMRTHLQSIPGHDFQQSPVMPLPFPIVTSPVILVQSPRLFSEQRPPPAGEPPMADQRQEQSPVSHPITAPAFDGCIYSVY